MERLTRTNGPAAAAWGEYSFVPDEDNCIEAPDGALEALACFGFVMAPPKVEKHQNVRESTVEPEPRTKRAYTKIRPENG